MVWQPQSARWHSETSLGVKIEHNVDPRDLFEPGFGDIVAEVPADKVGELCRHLYGDR